MLNLIKSRCLKYGHFTLASGKQSTYYINLRNLLGDFDFLSKLGHTLREVMQQVGAEYIGGPETEAIPIAVATTLISAKPAFWLRKKDKTHGDIKRLEGISNLAKFECSRVLLVDGTTTTGESLLENANYLRKNFFCEIAGIVSVVDREEGAKSLLEGFNYRSLYSIEDVLK